MDSISIRADQPLGVNHSGGYGKAPMSRNFYVAGTCATDVVSGITLTLMPMLDSEYNIINTLLVYDTFCTIEEESEFIWRRKLSISSVLYLAIRTSTLLNAVVTVTGALAPTTTTYLLSVISLVVALIAIAGFNVLRIWALWERHWAPVLVLFPLAMLPACINAYVHAYVFAFVVNPVPLPLGMCNPQLALDESILISILYVTKLGADSRSSAGALSRGCSLATDFLTLLLTMVRTYSIRKTTTRVNGKTDLLTLIIRDGSIYFGANLIINVAAVITNYMFVNISSPATQFSTALSSILFSRFILNIRGLHYDRYEYHSLPHFSSNFSARVASKIGAPLESYHFRLSIPQFADDPMSRHEIFSPEMGASETQDRHSFSSSRYDKSIQPDLLSLTSGLRLVKQRFGV
ncbi:hypothetical protein NLI96_g9180 [Meripilus lineatus]|uniref:DUF6533 domain-containing protein n=1 Tax=Meripilus lineatus TaxID=2056292 RepID=A0AAD5UY76_9APHY|nr:hypothetical protein NLI96_g9180 [Physisporinus lineatus]